ncbi:MAG: PilW family protein [Ketobacteraceae bacterium]|nr:PilW family protein [Ketobacteraceae bacterium]
MRHSVKQNQSGLSLVELMIAMTLGLLLLGGVLQFFVSSKRTFLHTEVFGKMEENGRFALDFLARDIRMAGYADPSFSPLPTPVLGGCSNDWCAQNGAGLGSDRIAIQLDPPDDRDCNGNSTAGPNDVIANVYWVSNDANNNNTPTLFCRGYNTNTAAWMGAAQPLVEGIETFQVLYGVTSPGTTTPARYISADQVTNWNKISAIKIGVLSQSGNDAASQQATRTFSILDSGPFEFTDGQPRTLYSTTVALNNAL